MQTAAAAAEQNRTTQQQEGEEKGERKRSSAPLRIMDHLRAAQGAAGSFNCGAHIALMLLGHRWDAASRPDVVIYYPLCFLYVWNLYLNDW